jgi:hypothetical protein
MKINIIKSTFLAAFVAAGIVTGCSPDEVTGGNPLTQADLDASFTSTITAETEYQKSYSFVAADADNIMYHTWKVINTTTGQSYPAAGELKTQENTHAFTFTTSGVYTVRHRVAGSVGGTNFVSEQNINISVQIPPQEYGPNLIQSPNFEDATDWTTFNTSATQTVTWTLNGDSATVDGGVLNAWSGQGIYQAIQVEAGTYYMDMHVESPGASADMWFQVFTGTNEPQQNADYLGDADQKMGLNTWSGCATAPFSGMLSEVGCVGTGTNVTFTAPQTIYFVIKVGSGADHGVNNITVKNLVFKKYL